MSKNITVNGDGNVIGDNNTVITQIHKGFSGKELRNLGEAFALLKGEIKELDTVSEKLRNRAVRAVEDAEEEAADNSPDQHTVQDSLKRAKDILERAGETYDSAKSWGKRFSDLGVVILPYLPAISTWISSLS